MFHEIEMNALKLYIYSGISISWYCYFYSVSEYEVFLQQTIINNEKLFRAECFTGVTRYPF